ncbi:hypothetical protein [Streptomyces wuyuanensis]|uniref:hypothetical protein n=1 Tax=Streptomyces wuyuanensis TaxID=1196353 RepID=UPI003798BF56
MAAEEQQEGQARGANGQWLATVETAERQAKAAELRSRGLTYRKIADELGVDVRQAHDDVRAAMRAIVEKPAKDVLAMELARLDSELDKLNALEESVQAVLKRKHFTISHGKIIYLGENPLEDDAPILMAVDRLVRIEESRRKNGESRRKLLGLDAPVKAQVSGGVTYEIVGVDLGKLT